MFGCRSVVPDALPSREHSPVSASHRASVPRFRCDRKAPARLWRASRGVASPVVRSPPIVGTSLVTPQTCAVRFGDPVRGRRGSGSRIVSPLQGDTNGQMSILCQGVDRHAARLSRPYAPLAARATTTHLPLVGPHARGGQAPSESELGTPGWARPLRNRWEESQPRWRVSPVPCASTCRLIYELVQKSQLDLFRLPNVGETSRREVKETLANPGLTLGMNLDEDSHRAAVVATVTASIEAARE